MNLRIPTGTRDLIHEEVQIKRFLQNRILEVFRRYCYQEVMTPAIEYYQTYHTAFSGLSDTEMYKFFDGEGDILTLRMDMTVPIARLAATRFKEDSFPLRLCYSAQVYKVKKAFAGKRHEVMDCGIELIGMGKEGDLEVISCALDTLKAIELDEAVLEIGNARLFQQACLYAELRAGQTEYLSSLIDSKSMIALEEFLESLDLPEVQKKFFLELPLLAGDASILKKAGELSFSSGMQKVVQEMESLNSRLEALGYSEGIRYDLGKIPHRNYYTDLIFEGYVPGAGHSILSGGRYDSLLEKFGLPAPAIGFSIKLDSLLDLYAFRPKNEYYEIRYPLNKEIEALKQARILRQEKPVLLIPCEQEDLVVEVIR